MDYVLVFVLGVIFSLWAKDLHTSVYAHMQPVLDTLKRITRELEQRLGDEALTVEAPTDRTVPDVSVDFTKGCLYMARLFRKLLWAENLT